MILLKMNDWYAPIVIIVPKEKLGASMVEKVSVKASANMICAEARISEAIHRFIVIPI